jgi:alkylation response protein AidB-like acyl-CoA dehydrogenase
MTTSEQDKTRVTEQEARQVAEASREQTWKGKSFLRELFMGRYRIDWLEGAQTAAEEPMRPAYVEYCRKLKAFLEREVDPAAIDATGRYPEHVIEGLKQLGAFGMKIPTEYDGLGFTQPEYGTALELVAEYDANLVALLSAHQSIGVPQPIKMFGTAAQKKKYLPRCAKGAISAFALTERDVGSDPARLTTTYTESDDGQAYIIDGEKLWCTNGTIAELLVVMARHPETKKISAFVVETDVDGLEVMQRCHFMGLRALENARLRFDQVRIPKDNLIGREGKGLKIALTTLNNGRLSLPAAAIGGVKKCLQIVREYAGGRVQWGASIGKHEAVAHMISDIATKTFAMEAVSALAAEMASRPDYDIRLAAAVAKEWNSVKQWEVIDDTMQVRGGRGYETEQSLAARGETPWPVERMMRDARINRIFEGSSEIMHLFIAREAVDKHLQVSGVMLEKGSVLDKIKALPAIIWFYAWWYTSQWVGWSSWPKYTEYGRLAKHVRYADRTSRRLARNLFHGMMRYRAMLEKKQAFLFRAVDVAMELFAMSASVVRAQRMVRQGHPQAAQAVELADMTCRNSRRAIEDAFHAMWFNEDEQKYALAQKLLQGEYSFVEQEPVDTSDWRHIRLPESPVRPETRRALEADRATGSARDDDRGHTAA